MIAIATGVGCATATPTGRARSDTVAQEHRLTTLESGVRIVTEAMPSVRSVSLGFWIGTGSRTESDEQAGLSHLLEHLLFKGSSKYGSLEIDQIFDAMGAELNAGTGKETTSVYARVIDQHLPEAFDVMADMVFRPALNDIESERAVILEEIAMYEDDPQEKVFDVLGEAVFGDHPLGRAIIGRAPVIADTPPAEIARFHASRYVPENIVIAAAGAIDHEHLVSLAAERVSAATASPPIGNGAGSPGGREREPALRAQGHRAVPRLHRGPGPLPPRRPAVRDARARHDLRRHVVLTAVPGDPRAARPRLCRLLVHQRLPGHRSGRPVRGHPAGESDRGAQRGRAASSVGCARNRRPPRSSTGPRRT